MHLTRLLLRPLVQSSLNPAKWSNGTFGADGISPV